MTPTEIARVVRWAVAALVVIALIVVGGWQLGWWFKTQNTNRQAQLYQNGYANQSAMRDEIGRKLEDVQRYTTQIGNPAYASDKANVEQSRAYAGMLVCGDAAQLNPGTQLPTDETRWIATNCEDGSLSPTSSISVATTPGQ